MKIKRSIYKGGISFFCSVDNKTKIHKSSKINRFVRIRNSLVGAYTYIGPSTRVVNCEIGKFCSISWDCMLGGSGHPVSRISTAPLFYSRSSGLKISWVNEERYLDERSCVVGNDVWIGAKCIVMPGVSVGDGAILGAASVVTRDVPPYAIVAGVPARIIGYRFDSDVAKFLHSLKWWDKDEDFLKKNIDVFNIENIDDEAINKINKVFNDVEF